MDKLNIANIAMGALLERADIEIDNVLRNILDKNTDYKKKRKVTLEITFAAMDESREKVAVELKAKSSVSPYNPVITQVFVGKDSEGQIKAEEFIRNKDVIAGQAGIQFINDKEVDTASGEILGRTEGKKIVNINR